jgi:hypothetical protein
MRAAGVQYILSEEIKRHTPVPEKRVA